VLELAAIGPAPFGVMLLADLGADVVRVDRRPTGPVARSTADVMGRGRRSIALDLKDPRARDVVLRLVEGFDVFVEGFRPGIAERLGLGPQECMARNPRLVYARMTGYGQSGPLARQAGHDLNFVATAGALLPIGPAEQPPPPPLNFVGDFGGGGAFLALGVLAALVERQRSGTGQVVDCAMVDGAAAMTGMFHGMRHAGLWQDEREANLLDGGAHYYRTYETRDGGYVAVAAVEPQFYAELLRLLALDPAEWPQNDQDRWPQLRARLAAVFATRDRAEWAALFAGTDACVSPVLSLEEATRHEHAIARDAFVPVDGLLQPAPAPRFSRTPGAVRSGAPARGADTREVLREAGFRDDEIDELELGDAPAQPATTAGVRA
jgi:alpha-methylacyl-CoA racemase